jgi:Na+/H+ antiporter NhaC
VEQNKSSPSLPATIFQIVLWSIVVGVVLSALGITPYNILDRLGLIFRNLYDLGFGAFDWAFRYFLLGAIIVVPIFLVTRFLGGRRG